MKSAGRRGYSPLARVMTLAVMLLAMAATAWADEQVFYTLDGTVTGGPGGYSISYETTQGGVTWSVTGNTTTNPWRIGGNSLNSVDRGVYSTGTLDETITKVTLDFGTNNGVTVNSVTMTVASDANFLDIIEEKTLTYTANSTVDVTPGTGISWTNAYYYFAFNVTVSGSSNKYLQLKSIKFYYDPDAGSGTGGGDTKYTVTMAAEAGEGWTIAPAEATTTGVDKDTKITATYSGTRHVKSVTAVTKAAAPTVTYTLLSAATTADYGKVVCAAGHLHDAKTAVPDGCTAVGILGKVTETGHGLILSLQDATSQAWNTINGWTSVTTYAGTTLKVLPDDAARGSLTSYTKLGETTVSNWAVAQKSDYEAIFTNLGSTTGDEEGKVYDANVNAYITTGVGGTAISDYYWSATELNDDYAWRFTSDYWNEGNKTYSRSVRPVLGF